MLQENHTSRSEGTEPIVVGHALRKVFGRRPRSVDSEIEQGLSRDEIFKRTGQTVAVRDSSFEVYPGEVFVLMGLSGSGKSTLLRLINRIIEPTSGRVSIGSADVTALRQRELIELRRRDVSMVFQSFALMERLCVWENAAFGLMVSGVPHNDRKERAMRALESVGLEGFANHRVDELSGGMRQRVGLARALAVEPKILLMDEAFSALDPLIRSEMQKELLQIRESRDLTVIFVSHDLEEAMRIGDRVAVMKDGGIVQIGSIEELLRHPVDDYVRSFFGGVDISRVYKAGDLARPDRGQLLWREKGPITLFYQLRNHDYGIGYLVDRDDRLRGVVSLESLLGAIQKGDDRTEDALIPVEPILENAPIEEVIHQLWPSPAPLPVIDDSGRFKGIITKSVLLETLEAREGDGE